MKHIVLSIVVALFSIQVLQAQEYTYLPDLKDQLLYGGPLELQTDSLPQIPKRKLLPDNMSFMEKGLWGENGFFRSAGLAAPLTPESRKSELALRRTMLVAHQIGGFVTLGSMITAAYFGQKLIDGNYGYRRNHQYAVTATIISYSATGLLAVLSPPPMIRRNEMSTTTIHKTLAWVHFAGMVLTPILGASIGRNATTSQKAHFHQVSAYITTAALAASLIVITF
ncbi:MAG: hypothetical protein NTX44_08535 [Ignavibacteriales bacterium]|nr:hypothetical protein [Ignavibacteriales bacterium]